MTRRLPTVAIRQRELPLPPSPRFAKPVLKWSPVGIGAGVGQRLQTAIVVVVVAVVVAAVARRAQQRSLAAAMLAMLAVQSLDFRVGSCVAIVIEQARQSRPTATAINFSFSRSASSIAIAIAIATATAFFIADTRSGRAL